HGVNDNYGLVRVWDVATGRQLWQEGRMGFPDRGLWPLGFLSDGKTLVVHDVLPSRVSLRDLATGKEQRSFALPRNELGMMALSPDAKTVMAGTFGTAVRAWDLATGKELP